MKLRTIAVSLLLLGAPLTACVSAADTTASKTTTPVQEASTPETGTSPAETTAPPSVDRDPQSALPQITFGDDGIPSMVPIDSTPPTDILVKTLKAGDGAVVDEGAFVSVNYAGFLWSDGSKFDSSYDSGEPARFLLNQVVEGWRYGLPGGKVGDRLQLVVPPDYGYGTQEMETIPAGSTLVFVVDILATAPIDKSALSNATPTGAALPAGLSISGDIGTQPTLTFAADAPQPTKDDIVVLAEGKGPTITDTDTVVYLVTNAEWGSPSMSSWPDQYQQIDGGGGAETIGQKVGSRLLLTYAASDDGQSPGFVLILDVVAAIPAA